MQPKPASPSLNSTSAISRRTRRHAAQPRLEYPADLPITSARESILSLIRSHQTIVVCGETGSGKSTQLPKICLDAGLGRNAMIGHTQPRRLAARSIAARLAQELDTPLGQWVGYKIRFGDQTGEETLVKLMTDGVLLAETQSDRLLEAYDAIIIDEAHERSLNIDFLLGYLKQLQPKRRDLKVIITSATIDAARFADHFGNEMGPAPIISVEGRGFPVEIRYLPWEEAADEEDRHADLARHVISGIEATARNGPGDILVFLPTERDIREVSHGVAGHFKRLGISGRVDLLPLYARLPQSEQQRIFQPDGSRQRIIFATNVAESSLTVPGIRYVIDTGTARISRYSARSKVQRLPIEPISRASADQRAGRCGRVGPGVCVRLYSLEDYESREAYTTPEIRRTNLAAVVLQTKSLGLGELADFPLLDPPKPEAIRDGIRTLIELNALDERHALTPIGRKLGRLPVDPRVGRILLAAEHEGCLPEILPIAAALEIPDPRDRPPDQREAADAAHAPFLDPQSDFLSLLRLWKHFEQARSQLGRNQLERSLRKQFLSPSRLREWADVYRQLRDMMTTMPKDPSSPARNPSRLASIHYEPGDDKVVSDELYEKIHRALLAGLLSGVAMAGDQNEYLGAGGIKLYLWPGSGLAASKPKWIVSAELVETSRQFARTVAKIEPRWIESVGAHVIKRSHVDPHWSSNANSAMCFENQTLFGLPVVVKRRVPLAPIDATTARDLLIDQGIVQRELRTNAKFIRQNQSLLTAISELAARTRRRELVIDDYLIARFYQNRLPNDVSDRDRLEKFDRAIAAPSWTKETWHAARVAQWLNDPPPADDPLTPYLRPDDLLQTDVAVTENAFPDRLEVGASKLPLKYQFEPGSPRDGIELKVHAAALSQLSEDRLDWLVPGLLAPKLTAMIKSLPKRIRRNLVPAAEIATQIASELAPVYGTVPFMTAVCQAMSRHAEVPVTASDFQQDKLDEFLQFLVTVVDDQGKVLGESRDLTTLIHRFAPKGTASDAHGDASSAADVDAEPWSRRSMQAFEIEHLPREVIRRRGGVQVAQYPGLVDLGDTVATRLYSDQAAAELGIRQGSTRLYAIVERKELRSQVRHLPQLEQSRIKLSSVVPSTILEPALVDLLARLAFVERNPVLRTSADFEARRHDRGQRVAIATQEISTWLINLGEAYFKVRRELEGPRGTGRRSDLFSDVDQQIRWLFFDGFLTMTPWEWLRHYPRYLQAIAYRIERGSAPGSRDEQSSRLIVDLWQRWLAKLPEGQRDARTQSSSEFRWTIEELRVSLFAQQLGTSVKVSPQRCEKLLQ